MIRLIIQFMLILLLYVNISCTSNNRKNTIQIRESGAKNERLISSDSLIKNDIIIFYDSFRISLINYNKSYLFSHISFPIILKGVLDSDPELFCRENDFDFVLNIFLYQYNGQSFRQPQNELDFLMKPLNSNMLAFTRNWFRYGNLEFRKIKKSWVLQTIYLNQDSYQELSDY